MRHFANLCSPNAPTPSRTTTAPSGVPNGAVDSVGVTDAHVRGDRLNRGLFDEGGSDVLTIYFAGSTGGGGGVLTPLSAGTAIGAASTAGAAAWAGAPAGAQQEGAGAQHDGAAGAQQVGAGAQHDGAGAHVIGAAHVVGAAQVGAHIEVVSQHSWRDFFHLIRFGLQCSTSMQPPQVAAGAQQSPLERMNRRAASADWTGTSQAAIATTLAANRERCISTLLNHTNTKLLAVKSVDKLDPTVNDQPTGRHPSHASLRD